MKYPLTFQPGGKHRPRLSNEQRDSIVALVRRSLALDGFGPENDPRPGNGSLGYRMVCRTCRKDMGLARHSGLLHTTCDCRPGPNAQNDVRPGNGRDSYSESGGPKERSPPLPAHPASSLATGSPTSPAEPECAEVTITAHRSRAHATDPSPTVGR